MDALRSGTHIKGYELQERIGSGGFGVVHRAHQSTVGREVAIKIILPRFANHPDFIRRFENEAHVVARLEHPFIVPLYDFWRDPEGAYLVMRFLRGGSLRKSLKADKFEPEEAAALLDQITSALALAHRGGVIHRDLKPENILMDEDGYAYLADFGIAKDLGRPGGGMTAEDTVVGSPDYISPEQARSQPITPRADVYSLGVVLYEMLAGEHPFPNMSPVERMYKHINDPLPTLKNLSPDIQDAVNAVIQKASAKNPVNRYAAALEFATAFREAAALDRTGAGESVVERLTPREHEILHLIVKGRSNAEIAQQLVVTIGTVKWYIRQIYKKLRVRNRVQAIVRARELDLVLGHTAISDAPSITPASFIPLPEPENPYKGLRAFQVADAPDYFGRERITKKLIERLCEKGQAARFLAVVGPSGSGKSSLVRAGLVPALLRGGVPGSDQWFIIEMMPGARPLDELEIALMRVATDQSDHLHEQLARDANGLLRIAQLILPDDDSELMVVIDQFEEVFTLVDDEERRTQFINLLHAAATDPRSRVRIIITLRADFYDRPLHYPEFGELVRSRMETVLPLSAEELEQAIVAPAERVGVQYEKGLPAAIIDEVLYQPGALPLLQYALTELFERRDNRHLTHESYREIGGTVGALAKRAEELFHEQGDAGKELIRQMFLRLVTLGEGTEDTRRRVPRSELLAIADDVDLMDDVINTFADYRLFALDHDPATRTPTVEVAHEAILREWERLRIWLNQSRDDVRMQRQLAALATEWHGGEQDASYLLRGRRLEQMEEWAADTELAMTAGEVTYLEASVAERERRLEQEREQEERETALQQRAERVFQVLMLVFLAAAILGVGLSVFAFGERNKAQDARSTAVAERGTSEHNAVVAQEQRDVARELALVNGAQAAMAKGDHITALALIVAASSLDEPSAQAQVALSEIAYAPGPVGVLTGHEGFVWLGWFSPDGRTIATMGDDGWIIWDATTHELLHRLPEGFGLARFTPDSRYLLKAPWFSGDFVVFDVEAGEVVRRFSSEEYVPDGGVFIAFSPDSSTFYTDNGGSEGDKLILEWDIETGEVIRRFQGATQPIRGLAVSPDGQQLLSGGAAGEMILWNLETSEIIKQVETGSSNSLGQMIYLPDGQRVMIRLRGDDAVALWDLTTFEPVRTYGDISSTGIVDQIGLSPDGRLLVATDVDSASVWDVETGERIATLPGVTLGVDFSPDGHTVLTAFGGGTYLWDVRSGAEIRRFQVRSTTLALSPDGTKLLAVEEGLPEDGVPAAWLLILDVETGETLQRWGPILEPLNAWGGVGAAAFSPDGNRVMIGDLWGQAMLWDLTTGEQVYTLTAHAAMVHNIAFSPDGRTAATEGTEGLVVLWDVETGREIRRFVTSSMAVWHGDYSPNGRTIAASSQQGEVVVWDVETGEQVRVLTGHTGGANGVAFSPDGNTLLSGGDDAQLILWDLTTGNQIRSFVGHTKGIFEVAFAPDGQTVFSTTGLILIQWDVTSGEAIRRYDVALGGW